MKTVLGTGLNVGAVKTSGFEWTILTLSEEVVAVAGVGFEMRSEAV